MDTPIQQQPTQIEIVQDQMINLYDQLEKIRVSESQCKAALTQCKANLEYFRKAALAAEEINQGKVEAQ